MIISCEKCDKKFQISDELIPQSGRLLQCGSCSYQWHYTPKIKIKKQTIIEETKISTPIIEEKINTEKDIKSKNTEISLEKKKKQKNRRNIKLYYSFNNFINSTNRTSRYI